MEQDKRPNILWLCTDQQRYDTLGCYGNKLVRTPNLDALAAGGVRFASAYAQNPVCTPSRASFLTGRYPRTCRTRQNGQDIPEDERLISRILHDAGYVCGLSGKLHLSSCNYSVCPISERRINDGYDYFKWSHGHGPAHEWPMHDYAIWLRGQGVEYSHPLREDSRYVRVGMPEKYHQTKWCADRAIEFIDAVRGFGKPWMFSFNCFDPHHAFDPPAEYLERYMSILDEIPLPNYKEGELDGKSPLQKRDHLGSYGKKGSFAYDDMTERDHRMIRAAYYAMCDLIDTQIGRILTHLKETGELENTIIVFHSDHGESLGDHGLYLKGGYFYEGSVHVPLIMSWKGKFREGATVNAPVELLDIAPTVVEACGLAREAGMQGRSLLPLLTGESGEEILRPDVYSEYYKTDENGGKVAFCTMLFDGRYKLTKIHYAKDAEKFGDCAGELYDLKTDPDERNNLYSNPDCESVRIAMLERLCDRMALTADPLPTQTAKW